MDVVEPGNESRDLIHVEAPSTPKTETDADVAPLIQKVGATSIVEIEKLMGELPRVGGLERYVQNQPTGAIVGSAHRGPCADKQRVKGANRTARPDHAVVPLIRCADLRCTQVIEARFAPDGQSVPHNRYRRMRFLDQH